MSQIDKNSKKPIRVLAWLDSPTCATGFAQVARGILNYLASTGKYDIDVIGINETGDWHDPVKYPYRIYPAKSGIQEGVDYHGRVRLINAVLGTDKTIRPPWDLIFTLNDPFILEQPMAVFNKGTLEILKETASVSQKKLPSNFWFKTISYWPVDSPVKGNWVEKAIGLADVSVAYTKYGYEEIVKTDKRLPHPFGLDKTLKIVSHGINPNIFKPMDPGEIAKFRQSFFEGRVKESTFLISAIARNQMRKDLPRTLQIFSEFIRRRPDSFLYLNCQENDAWGSLKEYARNFRNLEFGVNWGTPGGFNANQGLPIEAVNMVYNASDCILSTTLGEGFGFYNLEGMATKTIVVAPNNTTHPELFDYDSRENIDDMDQLANRVRGVPIKCASTSSEWVTCGPTDFERIRPLTNVDDAVKKLLWVYDHPDKVKEIEQRAYDWVKNLDWDTIGRQWDDIFQTTYDQLVAERQLAPKVQQPHARPTAVPTPSKN